MKPAASHQGQVWGGRRGVLQGQSHKGLPTALHLQLPSESSWNCCRLWSPLCAGEHGVSSISSPPACCSHHYCCSDTCGERRGREANSTLPGQAPATCCVKTSAWHHSWVLMILQSHWEKKDWELSCLKVNDTWNAEKVHVSRFRLTVHEVKKKIESVLHMCFSYTVPTVKRSWYVLGHCPCHFIL